MAEIVDQKIKTRLDIALNSTDNETQLINLVKELKIEGWSQLEVYDVFEKYYKFVDELNDESKSDVVADLLDYIYGWCGPEAKLFEHTLSKDEIYKYRESKKE